MWPCHQLHAQNNNKELLNPRQLQLLLLHENAKNSTKQGFGMRAHVNICEYLVNTPKGTPCFTKYWSTNYMLNDSTILKPSMSSWVNLQII